jgi:hypothetical protein
LARDRWAVRVTLGAFAGGEPHCSCHSSLGLSAGGTCSPLPRSSYTWQSTSRAGGNASGDPRSGSRTERVVHAAERMTRAAKLPEGHAAAQAGGRAWSIVTLRAQAVPKLATCRILMQMRSYGALLVSTAGSLCVPERCRAGGEGPTGPGGHARCRSGGEQKCS